MAYRPGLAVGAVEIQRGIRLSAQRLFRLQLRVQTPADGKALLCQAQRGLEQLRPWQLAMSLMRQLEQTHRAGYADRTPANHGRVERHRLAVGLQEQRFV